MRKRVFSWQGQRFVYLGIEGEPGEPLERQSHGLFERAGAELAALGLALDQQRRAHPRLRPHPRRARRRRAPCAGRPSPGRRARRRRAIISPRAFRLGRRRRARSVCHGGADRRACRARSPSMDPLQPFIRHLVWGPLVFHAGMTNEHLSDAAASNARKSCRAPARACKRTAATGRTSCASPSFCTRARTADALLAQRRGARAGRRSTMPRSSLSKAIRGRTSWSRSRSPRGGDARPRQAGGPHERSDTRGGTRLINHIPHFASFLRPTCYWRRRLLLSSRGRDRFSGN